MPASREPTPSNENSDENPHANQGLPAFGIPWERDLDVGVIRRLFRTIYWTMRKAPQLFFGIEAGHLKQAESFAYVVSLIGLLGYFAFRAAVFTFVPEDILTKALHQIVQGNALPSIQSLRFWGQMLCLSTPLLAIFPVHLAAGLYHVGLMLLGVEHRGYDVTFKVTAYGLAPMIILIIPAGGDLLAIGWVATLHWIGLAAAHRISFLAALVVMTLPFMLAMLTLSFL